MSGEVSASSIERASAAMRRLSAWSRSDWRRREQLAGAALLADRVQAQRGEREAGEQQPQRDEARLAVVADGAERDE